MKELSEMIEKRVWGPAHVHRLSALERGRIIRSRMFLKEKYLPTGQYEKLKARLVAGGNQQDKDLYEDLSSQKVGTSAVLTLSIVVHENRDISVVDITGAYLNNDMVTDAHDEAGRGLRKIRRWTGVHIGEATECTLSVLGVSWIFGNQKMFRVTTKMTDAE
jgi:hypothetical protein